MKQKNTMTSRFNINKRELSTLLDKKILIINPKNKVRKKYPYLISTIRENTLTIGIIGKEILIFLSNIRKIVLTSFQEYKEIRDNYLLPISLLEVKEQNISDKSRISYNEPKKTIYELYYLYRRAYLAPFVNIVRKLKNDNNLNSELKNILNLYNELENNHFFQELLKHFIIHYSRFSEIPRYTPKNSHYTDNDNHFRAYWFGNKIIQLTKQKGKKLHFLRRFVNFLNNNFVTTNNKSIVIPKIKIPKELGKYKEIITAYLHLLIKDALNIPDEIWNIDKTIHLTYDENAHKDKVLFYYYFFNGVLSRKVDFYYINSFQSIFFEYIEGLALKKLLKDNKLPVIFSQNVSLEDVIARVEKFEPTSTENIVNYYNFLVNPDYSESIIRIENEEELLSHFGKAKKKTKYYQISSDKIKNKNLYIINMQLVDNLKEVLVSQVELHNTRNRLFMANTNKVTFNLANKKFPTYIYSIYNNISDKAKELFSSFLVPFSSEYKDILCLQKSFVIWHRNDNRLLSEDIKQYGFFIKEINKSVKASTFLIVNNRINVKKKKKEILLSDSIVISNELFELPPEAMLLEINLSMGEFGVKKARRFLSRRHVIQEVLIINTSDDIEQLKEFYNKLLFNIVSNVIVYHKELKYLFYNVGG